MKIFKLMGKQLPKAYLRSSLFIIISPRAAKVSSSVLQLRFVNVYIIRQKLLKNYKRE